MSRWCWRRFQSTHPLRGATEENSPSQSGWGFQSTHPLRGATSAAFFPAHRWRRDFNPRTPCGVRPPSAGAAAVPPSAFQSTHPLRGATPSTRRHRLASSYFNPRTPCGVRQRDRADRRAAVGFQSTHPLRGATQTTAFRRRGFGISIHAPLAGCDVVCVLPVVATGIFQSTHPLRGAT